MGFFINPIAAQNCDVPSGLHITNLSNFSVTFNWTLDNNVNHYRLRHQEVGDSNWVYVWSATGVSHDILNLNANTAYIWQARAYCSSGPSPNSGWSPLDTFTTNVRITLYLN